MVRFNPFRKPFDELDPGDLARLRHVAEGWYVEYKEVVPSASSIAKSVAAFANHHGGWLFYGIAGSRNGQNTAETFPGLPTLNLPRLQERIRDSIAAHVDPTPHFRLRVMMGPCEEIGLGPDRAVVAIQVPLGRDAPFVHSSGRIYRRIADRSDPVHETDRRVLDLLWERGARARKRFLEIFEKTPELSQAEEGVPLVTLLLLRDPLFEQGTTTELTYDQFVDLMSNKEAAGIPFDSFSSTPEGYMARQVSGKPPGQVTVSWLHRADGTSVFTSPLRFGSLDQLELNDTYVFTASFCETVARLGAESSSWVDLNILLAIAKSTVARQLDLLGAGNLPEEVSLLARIEGVWRKIPFVDTDQYVASIERQGLPVIQTDVLSIPWRWDLDAAIPLEIPNGEESDDRELKAAVAVWFEFLVAVGLQRLTTDPSHLTQLAQAEDRGRKVYGGVREPSL